MGTILTAKCQVTIPKTVRETLGLGPGSEVEFDVDEQGRIFLRRADAKSVPRRRRARDRFDRARGRASVKWRTDEVMDLLRGDE